MATTSKTIDDYARELKLTLNESEYNAIKNVTDGTDKADNGLQELKRKEDEHRLNNAYNNVASSLLMSAAADGLCEEIAEFITHTQAKALAQAAAEAHSTAANKEAAKAAKEAKEAAKEAKKLKTKAAAEAAEAAKDKAAEAAKEAKDKADEAAEAAEAAKEAAERKPRVKDNLLTLGAKPYNDNADDPRFYNYSNKSFVALNTKQEAKSWAVALYKEYVRTSKEAKASKQRKDLATKVAEAVKQYCGLIPRNAKGNTGEKIVAAAVMAAVPKANLEDVFLAITAERKAREDTKELTEAAAAKIEAKETAEAVTTDKAK